MAQQALSVMISPDIAASCSIWHPRETGRAHSNPFFRTETMLMVHYPREFVYFFPGKREKAKPKSIEENRI
jgi:hypothetical protein